MPLFRSKRRVLIWVGSVILVLVGIGIGLRVYLAGVAISTGLKEAGATEVTFRVTDVSPWRVAVSDVGFLLRLQRFAADRVTLVRPHWWTLSLGALRVERARMPVNVAVLTKPIPPTVEAKPSGVASLPFEEITIDGQLVIQAGGMADQALTVKIDARPIAKSVWAGTAAVTAPGLELKGEGNYDSASGDVTFKIPHATLDLKPWQGFFQQIVPVPAGDWDFAGKLSGWGEGRFAGEKLIATGGVKLREGQALSTSKDIAVEGIEADLEFSDFASLTTRPGTLRIRELRTGQLTLQDLAADFSLRGTDHIDIARATLQTLGGRVAAEPFALVPSRAELDAVLVADGISIEQVMALTKDLPARATGRLNGRVPLRIGSDGLRLGTGWLELKPGVQAAVQLNAKGLLTGGAAPGSPRYTVLQKVESGLLTLRISELRLDIRPTNAPEGRSAQLHLKGEPVDPEVKAPVILDLNVNGPLEKLINMGMDSRLSIGTGK